MQVWKNIFLLFLAICIFPIFFLQNQMCLLKDKKWRLQSKNTFIGHSEFLSQHRGMRNGYRRHGVSVGVSQGRMQEFAHILSKLVLALLVPTTSPANSLIEYFISAMYYILWRNYNFFIAMDWILCENKQMMVAVPTRRYQTCNILIEEKIYILFMWKFRVDLCFSEMRQPYMLTVRLITSLKGYVCKVFPGIPPHSLSLDWYIHIS